jgi:hypothetical protein
VLRELRRHEHRGAIPWVGQPAGADAPPVAASTAIGWPAGRWPTPTPDPDRPITVGDGMSAGSTIPSSAPVFCG